MLLLSYLFFFFNDTATTEISTLSLHDALPISQRHRANSEPLRRCEFTFPRGANFGQKTRAERRALIDRSEEHTSELQSQSNLVCRLLLEKKKNPQPHDLSCIVITNHLTQHYD